MYRYQAFAKYRDGDSKKISCQEKAKSLFIY